MYPRYLSVGFSVSSSPEPRGHCRDEDLCSLGADAAISLVPPLHGARALRCLCCRFEGYLFHPPRGPQRNVPRGPRLCRLAPSQSPVRTEVRMERIEETTAHQHRD